MYLVPYTKDGIMFKCFGNIGKLGNRKQASDWLTPDLLGQPIKGLVSN